MTAVAAIALARSPPGTAHAAEVAPPPAAGARILDINEYRVEGADHLSRVEVETVLAPFLGPQRPLDDVERARAALEKAYSEKGYQSVAVAIPQQTVRDGVVALRVSEAKIGRLRVRGSRWFSLSEIRSQAPSMAEGTVPNFNDIVRDVAALNQIPDRRVIPSLKPGTVPGTVDVDLNVQDTFPLHGSLEMNNRYSLDTTHTRLNAALHYDNLWQSGHSLSLSFQTAPHRTKDAMVFAGSYLARFADPQWLSLMVNAVDQNSDVSTLGGISVAGRGRVIGARALFTLPGTSSFFHTVTAGMDYKRFLQNVALGTGTIQTPVTYWPLAAQYSVVWQREASQTTAGAGFVLNLGPLGNAQEFDDKRLFASPSFICFRGDASRTDDLPLKFQLFEKVLWQYSRKPLVSSEQFVAGGGDSVRGYLEGQIAADRGVAGTVELRGPSMANGSSVNELRLLAFLDGAWAAVQDPTPEQQAHYRLLSAGGGARIKAFEHLNGSVDVGVPLRAEAPIERLKPRVILRVWTDF